MIADMTTATGRFNLVQGFIGTVIAIAAAISTGTTGFLFAVLAISMAYADGSII
jgi:hypothetical protein